MAFKILTEKSGLHLLEILLLVNCQPLKNLNLQNPLFPHNNNPTAILSPIWQLLDWELPLPLDLLLGPLPGLSNSPNLLSSNNNNPGNNNNLDNLYNSLDVLVPNNPLEHNSHKDRHLYSAIKVKPPKLNYRDQGKLR